MKLKLLCLFILLLAPVCAKAQFEAGLRNSRYLYGSFTLKKHYSFGLEHSISADRIGFQQIGVSFGYDNQWKDLEYGASVKGATSWNGDYQIAGLNVHAAYSFLNRLQVFGQLNPLYDTDYDYKTCFAAGAACKIVNGISVFASYTTIPDYRKSEKRVHAGFMLKSGHLYAEPALSIPVGDDSFNSVRVLVSLGWRF